MNEALSFSFPDTSFFHTQKKKKKAFQYICLGYTFYINLILVCSACTAVDSMQCPMVGKRRPSICFVLLSQFTNSCPKAGERASKWAKAGGIICSAGWDRQRRKHLAKPPRRVKIRFLLQFEGEKIMAIAVQEATEKLLAWEQADWREKHCLSPGRCWAERELTVIPSILAFLPSTSEFSV